MEKIMYCKVCPIGHKERIVGDEIYLSLIRCPYDNKYYKHPNDVCSHQEENIFKGE